MKRKYLVIGVIIGLVLGSGGFYVFSIGQRQEYLDEIEFLEIENLKLQSQLEMITEFSETQSAEINSLESQIIVLNTYIETLENQIQELNSQIIELE